MASGRLRRSQKVLPVPLGPNRKQLVEVSMSFCLEYMTPILSNIWSY